MNELGAEKTPFLFIISFDCERNFVIPLAQVDSAGILYKAQGITNSIVNSKPGKFVFETKPVDFARYSEGFRIVMENLLYGNTYLLNLTYPSEVMTNLSLEGIFHVSDAKYKLLAGDFTCFSPETFVKISDGFIYSYPMKGTIDASLPDALGILLADEKETAEHNTIVDLIRNDLGIVSESVRVLRYRYADYIKTNNKNLIQISSEIRGVLPDDYQSSLGDIMFSLLPAGSVTGAPKKKTVEIISEAEKYDRGYYTGVFGIFDGSRLDSAVMIRFIERQGGRLWFKSGGGITARSDMQKEYLELIDKIYVPVF